MLTHVRLRERHVCRHPGLTNDARQQRQPDAAHALLQRGHGKQYLVNVKTPEACQLEQIKDDWDKAAFIKAVYRTDRTDHPGARLWTSDERTKLLAPQIGVFLANEALWVGLYMAGFPYALIAALAVPTFHTLYHLAP